MMETQSHSKYWTTGPYAQFVLETRSAGSNPVSMVYSSEPAGDFSDPPIAELTLVHISKHSEKTTRDYGAGKLRAEFHNGDFELIPPSTAASIYCEGPHSFTAYAFSTDVIQGALRTVDPKFDCDFGILHAKPFRKLELSRLCRLLWQEARAGNPMGSLCSDALSMLVAAELYNLSGKVVSTSEVSLSDLQMKRVEEVIDTLLAEDLDLDQLSAEVQMDPMLFLKAFRATAGLSVSRYVLERRVIRARRLLTESNAPIAEIAYECGFSSQQHMTNTFSARLGISPGKLRKEAQR